MNKKNEIFEERKPPKLDCMTNHDSQMIVGL